MIDLIKDAVNKKQQLLNSAKTAASTPGNLAAQATGNLSAAKDTASQALQDANNKINALTDTSLEDFDRIKNLPSIKDPELLKQEAEARVQLEISKLEEKKQKIQEEATEKIKKALELYVMFQLGNIPYPKLPVIDPKTLAWNAYLKAKNEIMQLKQSMTKANLKKAKEKFTYPITKKVKEVKKPSFKDIPRSF